jgi:hypothetical protein
MARAFAAVSSPDLVLAVSHVGTIWDRHSAIGLHSLKFRRLSLAVDDWL